MKILVTGAGGMLGSDLCAALGSRHTLLGIGRHAAPHLSIPYQILDLSDRPALDSLFQSWKPELVIHCAAMTHVDACEQSPEVAFSQNVGLLENVITASNQTNAYVIFFSSDYVFDGNRKGAYTEEDTPSPLSVYGRSKMKAEELLRTQSHHYCIFRISWLYGIHGKSFPRTLLELVKKQKLFEIVSDQIGRPTFTQDLARTLADLLSRDPSPLPNLDHQIFHLANEGAVSWYEFGKKIFEFASESEVNVKAITTDKLSRPAKRPLNSILEIEKIKRELNVSMRSWEDALRDFLTQFFAQSELNKKNCD